MKTKLLFKSLVAGVLLLVSNLNYGQAPPMGTASDFVLFSSVGAMTNVGTYQYLTLLTGNVGTNSGVITNFGNVNGVMHSPDAVTAQANADLITARDFLVAAVHDSAITNPVFGNDSIIKAGTYLFPPSAVSLDLTLTLDAQGDPNAVFIFKMAAVSPIYAFSTSANAKVKLINGAQACNVYWYISGAVDMAAGTSMKGTIIAGGAITMGALDTLEGRALTVNGQVLVNNGDEGFLGYLPVDIASPLPTGPAAPVFVESKDYAIFSSIGTVSDDGTSHIDGSVGGNSAAPTGFNPLFVTGSIDGMNPATAAAAADLTLVYNSLNTLTPDIELLAPAQFGHNLVLTPNTYVMNTAVTFTDTVFMDACNNLDAVFIVKTYGAFATSSNSKVVLIRGAQAKNIYWMVNGAVSLGGLSVFNGNIIANNGAIDLLTGATLNGRALTTNGAISTIAMATILPNAPLIVTNPIGQTVCEGDSVSLTVEATGSGPFTYQWRKGEVDLIDGGNISGVTNDTLVIDPVSAADAAADYNVIVYGSIDPSDTSDYVSLVVNTAPLITTQPIDQEACAGSPVSFEVVATGSGLTYQWRKGLIDLTNTGNITGANSATLTIDPLNVADAALNYNVVITGTCTPPVTSVDVSLVVNTAPVITTQPIDQEACAGSPVSFEVVATGSGLTYQWRKGLIDLTNTGNISGATTATLTIDPLNVADAALNYNVVITGTCTPPVTSDDASLTVNSAAVITTQPVNQEACAGSPVSFEVVATGTDLTYQWRKGLVDLTNTGNIIGATTAVLTLDPVNVADAALDYNVVISNSCAADLVSGNASLTVNSAPLITTQPANQEACAGSPVSFEVVATGSGLTYQWRKGLIDLTNTGNITGATTAVLTLDPLNVADAALDYNVVITGTCTPPVTSDNASLAVNSAAAITTQPANQEACAGSPVSFEVVATGSDLTYQWRKGLVDLTNTGNITGATTAVLTIDPLNVADAALDYNVVVSSACAADLISGNASLTVNSAPAITTQPIDQEACAGSPVSFEVVATGSGLTYQWRKGLVDLTNTGNITGATTATLTIDPLNVADAALDYNVVITGTCTPPVTSVDASLTVNSAAVITTQPANQAACAGDPLSFEVVATGTDLTYQWRKGLVDLTNTGNISGATTAILTLDPLNIADAALDYNVVISSVCAAGLISDNASLEINSAPAITTEPVDQSVNTNESASFTVEATGTALTYQWRKGTVDLVDAGNISGATTATLTINPVTAADATSDYNVVVSGACTPSVTSANASLTILGVGSVITVEPVETVVCNGSAATFSVTAVGADLSYQWRLGAVDLVDGGNISGATTATMTIDPVTNLDVASDYNVIVSLMLVPVDTSDYIALVLNTPPVITGNPVTQTSCAGILSTFTVTAIGSDLTYQWRRGITNLVDGGNISGATTNTLVIDPVTNADEATDYNVVVSGACSPSVTSNYVSLEITDVGIYDLVFGTSKDAIKMYPSPFENSVNIVINDNLFAQMEETYELRIYNVLGTLVIHTRLEDQLTVIETRGLKQGVYFFQVSDKDKLIQSGKIISK